MLHTLDFLVEYYLLERTGETYTAGGDVADGRVCVKRTAGR